MGFDRMRIPFVRSLSASFVGSSSSDKRRRSKSRSRTREHPTTLETPSLNASTVTVTATDIPPVPPIPTRHVQAVAMKRKIWVKRTGASSGTRIEVDEDDLVDNVRDAILLKYANSLGRSIDSPDITLKIVTRDPTGEGSSSERVLGPEEPIGRTLDDHFPNGQLIDDALIIDIPQKRTPRPSPRTGNHQVQYVVPAQYRPPDDAQDYFGQMPMHSPHLAHVPQPYPASHSMTVLATGQLPALPSPGGGHPSRRHPRPRYGRQHTSSPTILHSSQTNGMFDPKVNGQPNPPIPTPPPHMPNEHNRSITPPNRVSSPHPGTKPKKKKSAAARPANGDKDTAPKPASAALLDGTVPPINVLLVEDNVINLKLLEQFMRRLKVRWKSAMNGKEAVAMWRAGGFHLVLMDIQLPIMSGLDATKEIRRLEAVNGIGVFSGSPIEGGEKLGPCNGEEVSEDDRLHDRTRFKSPVIIVALTASSLQSDRHEALAAGCNDFLTKPVNFVWMERKVTEWGCMQSLIDFDGWRKWKAYAKAKESEDPVKKAAEEKAEKAKARDALKAMFSRPPPTSSPSSTTKKEEKPKENGTVAKKQNGLQEKKQKSNRTSSGGLGEKSALNNVEEVDEGVEK